ncbi:MAG: Ig-like domain-containing protein, partial [Rhodoferax sp.]|nr:Ig-like domain-containing protein [Rhodoferax sp.]
MAVSKAQSDSPTAELAIPVSIAPATSPSAPELDNFITTLTDTSAVAPVLDTDTIVPEVILLPNNSAAELAVAQVSASPFTMSAEQWAASGAAAIGVLALNGGSSANSTPAVDPAPGTAALKPGAKGITVVIKSDRSALKSGQTASITFTFSTDPGDGFDLQDIAVSGGTLTELSNTGSVRTATFTPNPDVNDGSTILSVADGWFTDSSGIGDQAPPITFDTKAPTLSISSNKSALLKGEAATITFRFSEDPGSTFEASDITLPGGGTLTDLGTTGAVRTATFTPTADINAGSASISVGNGSFTDTAGNDGIGGSALTIGFDTKAPTLTITSDRPALRFGQTASITFTFSEDPLSSFDAADIVTTVGTLSTLNGSGSIRTAIFTPMVNTESTLASITVAADRYTDAAGNNGTAANTLNLSLDTRLPSVQLQLGTDIANGAALAEATGSTGGVVHVTAESGSLVTLSFTDQNNTRINQVITGTGNAQPIALAASEMGVYGNQLHDGTITVNAVAVDRAGNVSMAISHFALDTAAPVRPSFIATAYNIKWLSPTDSNNRAAVRGFASRASLTWSEGWGSFSAEAGSTVTVKYFVDSASSTANLVQTVTATGGMQSIMLKPHDFDTFLSDFSSSSVIRITQQDKAGNTSTVIQYSRNFIAAAPTTPLLGLGNGVSNGATLAEATAGLLTVNSSSSSAVKNGVFLVDVFGHSVGPIAVNTGANQTATLAASHIGTGAGQLQDGIITATLYSADFALGLARSSISFVLDTTAPKLAAATIAANRASITLTFTEDIDSSALTLAAANSLLEFKTSTSGNSAISSPYSAISVRGNTATLPLTTPLTASETATVQYSAAASDATSAGLQDTAGNGMATQLAAVSLSDMPVISGFTVSDSDSGDLSKRGKASEAVAVQVSFSEDVTLSASTTYTVRVQIGSNPSDGFDATLVTTSVPTASNSYRFTGTLPATTGLESNALTLTSLTIPSGKSITGSTSSAGSSRAVVQSIYTLSSNSYLVDSTAPTLDFSWNIATDGVSSKTTMTSGDSATLTFHFSEDPGSSFAWDGNYGDITVTGGTLSDLWGSGQMRYARFVPLTSNTNNGLASISVSAGRYTDALGNAGTGGTTTIAYDTLPPLTPIIELGSGVQGGATAAEMVQDSGVVTVEAERGQVVTVTFTETDLLNSVSKTITGAGMGNPVAVVLSDYDVFSSLFSNGADPGAGTTVQVLANALDAAGNSSRSTSSFLSVTDPPIINNDLVTFIDTGVSSTDGITQSRSVATANFPKGSSWQYSTDAGATWSKGSGNALVLAANTSYPANSIQFRVTDAAGNSKTIGLSKNTTHAITIDTSAPEAPGITLLDGLGNSGNGATARITAESG